MEADRPRSTTPTSSCSTPAASARTPTTSSTAPSATSSRSRPTRPELEIVVGGCLAQKDRDAHPGAGRPRRRRARHPQRAPGRRPAPRAARADGPSPRSGRRRSSTRPRPSPPRCRRTREVDYAAWVTIQIGCDNSCAFCIVPSVRGTEISRPFGELVAEVERLAADGVVEVTLLGQNVNSYGRDLTTAPRAEPADAVDVDRAGAAWAADDRRRARPLFADLLAAVGRRRGHPPGALHQPAPQGPAPRDHRGHGGQPGGVPAPAPAAAVGQRPHPGRHAPRLHRRALPRAAGRGPARPSPTWPSPPTSSSASPARPTTTSSAPSRWWPRPSYDSAYTFIYSPRPGTEAAERIDEFVPPRSSPTASTGCGWSSSAPALAKHEARIGRVEEVLVEGPEQARTPRCSAAAPARTSWCTCRRRPSPAAGHLRRRRASPAPVPTSCAASCVEVTAAPRHRTRIPVVAV